MKYYPNGKGLSILKNKILQFWMLEASLIMAPIQTVKSLNCSEVCTTVIKWGTAHNNWKEILTWQLEKSPSSYYY